MKIQDFSEIADFKEIALSDLNKAHAITNISNDLYDIEDLFGEEPETVFYYQGDVHLTEDLIFDGADEYAYFLIDGNLKIDGIFSIEIWGQYNVIGVTGNLEAENLLLSSEAFLCVLGDTNIESMIYNDISDGGACVFHGDVSAKALMTGRYGYFEFCKEEAVRGEMLDEDSLKDEYQDAEFEEIVAAVAVGETIYSL